MRQNDIAENDSEYSSASATAGIAAGIMPVWCMILTAVPCYLIYEYLLVQGTLAYKILFWPLVLLPVAVFAFVDRSIRPD